MLKLSQGQDITALALNVDNTNLLVSTEDKQLIIFTDPAVSLSSIYHFDTVLVFRFIICSDLIVKVSL